MKRCSLLALCFVIPMSVNGLDFAHANDKKLVNDLGMQFVLIPAGTYKMGPPETLAEAQENKKPQHRVTISKPFYMGKYEVTQAQWETLMGSNPYTLPRSNPCFMISRACPND